MKYLVLVLKGMGYGITHIMPGLGGGLILLMMGIYEQFIDSVGNLFVERHKWREHLSFLVPLGVGMVLGMAALAKVVTIVMERWPVPPMFFFMGLLIGALPRVVKMHPDMRFTPGRAASTLLGVGVVVLSRIMQPSDASALSMESLATGSGILYNMMIGFLGGCASVTPGLDGSYAMLVGGTYNGVIEALSDLVHLTIHWAVLVPFGISAVAGIFLFSKCIDIAIKRIPTLTYYLVMGLIVGSIYGLWPREGLGRTSILMLVIVFTVGFALTTFFGGPKDQPAA